MGVVLVILQRIDAFVALVTRDVAADVPIFNHVCRSPRCRIVVNTQLLGGTGTADVTADVRLALLDRGRRRSGGAAAVALGGTGGRVCATLIGRATVARGARAPPAHAVHGGAAALALAIRRAAVGVLRRIGAKPDNKASVQVNLTDGMTYHTSIIHILYKRHDVT